MAESQPAPTEEPAYPCQIREVMEGSGGAGPPECHAMSTANYEVDFQGTRGRYRLCSAHASAIGAK